MSERETLEVDVLIVGAGPAGLSAAYRFMDLVQKHNADVDAGKAQGRKLDELMVAVVDKGSEVGAHQLSGAVMDPVSMKKLMPDFVEKGCPLSAEVKSDEVVWLSEGGALKLPLVPPPLRQHGNYIISLSKMVKWLAPLVEEKGVMIMPGFAGTEVLYESGDSGKARVCGVRMVDRGVDKKGEKKSNHQLGEDIKAKVTLFCDGTYGNLTNQVVGKLGLDKGKNQQIFATGCKEIWEVEPSRHRLGHVTHTMGWPLKSDAFGGGWLYHMADNLVSVGFVVGLDYKDPFLDPHAELQRFKTHPSVRAVLEGGKMVSYGAKTIPEGGWNAMPYLAADGALILGDAAGMVNVPKLKGIHYAMEAGMLAAETLLTAFVKEDYTLTTLRGYHEKVVSSVIGKDLQATKNFKEYFKGGFYAGLIKSGISFYTGGSFPGGSGHMEPDYKDMKSVAAYHGSKTATPSKPTFDGKLTFSKLDDIYVSGTTHEEDQPCHLIVKDLDLCRTKCTEEYGNPCQHFCPASVYNWITDEANGKGSLLVNAPNCVHCKTCDIKDPYKNIVWTVPEGGGGPNYQNL